jgi:hypothetical protein
LLLSLNEAERDLVLVLAAGGYAIPMRSIIAANFSYGLSRCHLGWRARQFSKKRANQCSIL